MWMDSWRLLKEDATLSMPPVPSWYQGREAIRCVLSCGLISHLASKSGGVYLRRVPMDSQHLWCIELMKQNGLIEHSRIQVLTLDGSQFPRQVASLTAFLGPELVASFGFPLQLPQ